MATVAIANGSITIDFGPWERLLTGRARHVIPLSAVRRAAVTDTPVRVPRGARKGLTVSGYTKIGVWGLYGGTRQLVSVNRNLPGLHLELDRSKTDSDFDEVVVSVSDATRLLDAIRSSVA